MKPSPPTKIVWVIALAAGILGIVGYFGKVAPLSGYSFWLVLAGFVLLALGTSLKDV